MLVIIHYYIFNSGWEHIHYDLYFQSLAGLVFLNYCCSFHLK